MESIIESFKKMTYQQIVAALLVLIFMSSPGILTIWMFSPSLIESASPLKLILLSSALMFPAIAINTYITSFYLRIKGNINKGFIEKCFIGFIFTVLQFIFSLLICFLFGFQLNGFCLSLLIVMATLLFLHNMRQKAINPHQ